MKAAHLPLPCFLQVFFGEFGKIKWRIQQQEKGEFGKGPYEPKMFEIRPFAAEILPTSQ